MSEKQGVAQRVLSGIDARATDSASRGDSHVFSMYRGHYFGAQVLLNELSAEARRVLAEEGFERRPQIVDALRGAFTRLGFDLSEPEDSDE